MSQVAINTVADLKLDGGIRPAFVDAIIGSFRRTPGAGHLSDFSLTDLQRLVANDIDAVRVDGPNLVIAAPPSAGKTLAAEIIIARLLTAARRPYGCIYAVPTRALATEKWERFKSVFGEEHVYVSSGDYQDQDGSILHRPFRVAVVVYEKLYGWLLRKNAGDAILNNLGLLVIDELHMLGDTQRGPRLELLLTFMRKLQAEGPVKVRIVGLGPSREALSRVAAWLDAHVIAPVDDKGPVPLLEGYICPNTAAKFVKLDARLAPDQVALPQVRGNTREAMLIDLVWSLLQRDGRVYEVGSGKRILIYSPSKDGAERLARILAETLGIRQDIDTETAEQFGALEKTHATQGLRNTFRSGVGFHHGDLLFEERRMVEKLFRAERPSTCLDVVVCTPTLAMGVNLPADYMLFPSSESYKPKDWDARSNLRTPLTPLEYRNFAGRAGRYRPNAPPGHHGVALFISDRTDEEAMREIVEPIILGQITPIGSEMHRWPFGIETLALAAAHSITLQKHSAPSHEAVRQIFQATLAGTSGARLPEPGKAPLPEGVIPKLCALAERHHELITPDFAVPLTGTVVARAGIHILTYQALKRIAERAKDDTREQTSASATTDDILEQPLVILEELALVPEIVKLYPTNLSDTPREQATVARELRRFLRKLHEEGKALGPRAETMIAQTHVPDRTTLEALMRVAAVWLWIEGASAEEIGSNPMLPGLRYGACNLLGDQLHWLVSILPDLWDGLGLTTADENRAADIRWAMGRLERRLRFGVPDALVGIAQLRVPGLHRENMMEIWKGAAECHNREWGWDHPVEILDIPARRFGQLRSVVKALQRAVLGRGWRDDPRAPSQKQIDIARMVCEGEGRLYVDSDWPESLRRLWTVSKNDELVQSLGRALTLKPLCLNVREQHLASGSRYFLFENGRHILLEAIGDGTSASWDEIRALTSTEAPNGKPVDGVVVVANGNIDEQATGAYQYGRAVRIVTREALGHMIIQALMSPEETAAEASLQSGTVSIPQAVRTWICADAAGILKSAAEADRALKSNGLDDWLRESRWIQGRSGQRRGREAPVTDVQESSLRNDKLQILRKEVDRIEMIRPLDPIDSEVDDFVATLTDDLLRQVDQLVTDATSVAAFVRSSLEELAKHVLDDHGQGLGGRLELKLDAIRKRKLMSAIWVDAADALRKRSNVAHHVGEARDVHGRYSPPDFSFDEAWELLSSAVRLWTEYVRQKPSNTRRVRDTSN